MCSSSAAVWPVCIPRSPPRRAALRCVFSAKARPAAPAIRWWPCRCTASRRTRRPARGLPPPLPCFRRGTAGRGARGVLCRSRCRGHGAAARSRPAARIPDAFGKRRGISVSRLLLAQAGTHSDEGRAGEAERVSQYRRGGRRDRLRYSYRKRAARRASSRSAAGRCAYTRPKR